MTQKPLSLAKDKIRFLLLEGVHPEAEVVLRQRGYSQITTLPTAIDHEQLLREVSKVHFLGIRSRTQVTEAVLASADRLLAIGCFCIGTDQVDLSAARQHGVSVFNAPYANTRSVAELVLAEIIMLMRGIPARNAAAHRGQWLKGAQGAHEVRGKTLGIIGYGHIGSQLGILAEGLGMRVVYHDIEAKLPLGNAEASESMENVLAAADVVSLHVPDTEQTRHLIDATRLSQMRAGAHLINASRGQVVDIDALRAALTSGHIASAGLDVFPVEPTGNDDPFQSPLCGMDNVLLTPHIGGSTHEAQENIARDVAAKLAHYSDNGSTMGAVNFPQVALPDHAQTRRIMHIHRNEPGVLQALNAAISESEVNIAAQYLQTLPDVGYVVMDLECSDPAAIVERLSALPATIRCRYLL